MLDALTGHATAYTVNAYKPLKSGTPADSSVCGRTYPNGSLLAPE